MPTVNLSVSNNYAAQETVPDDTPINTQNSGSYDVEIYIGVGAPTNERGVILKPGEMVTISVSAGETLYTKTKEADVLGHLVGVY